jgi:hypothetical protein
MGKQMTSRESGMVRSSTIPTTWRSIDWKEAGREVRRLQMRIAKAVQANCGIVLPGQSFEMLEPYDGKLSRTVLRGEWGCKPPALSDRQHFRVIDF